MDLHDPSCVAIAAVAAFYLCLVSVLFLNPVAPFSALDPFHQAIL